MISGSVLNKITPAPAATTRFRRSGSAIVCASILLAARLLPMPGVDGKVAHMPSICLFHNLTGLACPACGLTRSLICIAHGHIQEGIAYHPLGPIVLVVLVAAVAYGALQATASERLRQIPAFAQKYAAFAAISVVMIAWVCRLEGLDPLPN